MNNLKEAFGSVRSDINNLNQEIFYLNEEITEIKSQLKDICSILEKLSEKAYNSLQNKEITSLDTSTDRQQIFDTSTHPSTYNSHFKPLNSQNLFISTGNEGVSTDRQQTDNRHLDSQKDQNSMENAVEILDSLDSLKKEIRLKFKRLTEQEVLVFSALYQLEESNGFADYKTLSSKLNLTESSIRDYIRRLITKEVPINKNKLNNKSIQLSISDSLKKIATLPTILQLREI